MKSRSIGIDWDADGNPIIADPFDLDPGIIEKIECIKKAMIPLFNNMIDVCSTLILKFQELITELIKNNTLKQNMMKENGSKD